MIGLALAFILGFLGGPVAQTQTGVITGQLRAQDNSTPAGVRVAALTVPSGNMGPETGPNYYNAGPAAATALTDNQGRYRLENVPPGRYYVLGGLIGEPTYYPDAADTNNNNATIVTVAAGQTVPDISFKLLQPFGRNVSGRLNLNAGLARGQTVTLTGSKVEEFLEIPVRPDGTFDFGRVPQGLYLLSTAPPPPGLSPIAVPVRNADVTGLVLTSPPTQTVTGKIVMQNGGPIPQGILGFYNIQSYIGATVSPDGTFTAKLHAARHRVDVAGMPVGYSLASVRIGSTDAAQGFTVANSAVSDVVVTIAAPTPLPRLKGRITGLAPARLPAAKVELTGPIFGSLVASIQQDGSFEFPIMVPGLYRVRLLQVAEFTPMELVVTYQALTEVQLTVPAR